MGSAVWGLVSIVLYVDGMLRFSFDDGEEVPAESIDDIEFETECPGRTVLAESLDTMDNGLGMIETSSENPTRVFLKALGLGSGSARSDIDLAGCNAASREPGTTGCCSFIAEGDVGALPPRLILGLGFNIKVKSLTLMAADLL